MMDGWVGGEEEMYKLGLLKTHLANTKSAFGRGGVSSDVEVHPLSITHPLHLSFLSINILATWVRGCWYIPICSSTNLSPPRKACGWWKVSPRILWLARGDRGRRRETERD